MDRLNRLPEVTDQVLAGVKADESLKHRILLAAAAPRPERKTRFRTALALCGLSVLLVLLCVFASRLPLAGKPADLQVIPAGSHRDASPVHLQTVLEKVPLPSDAESGD